MSRVNRRPKGLYAGQAFALLAGIFLVAFGIAVLLLGYDQQRVIDANSRLQESTVPEIIRYQRLARNLEQLRQEGERIFAVSSHAARQQSMFVVTLIASHPSVLEHPGAAMVARETEQFLDQVVRQSADDGRGLAAYYDEWQRLSAHLGMEIDDVSIEGINVATAELNQAAEAMKLARYKLMLVLFLVGFFLFVFIVLVRHHLIHPLQRIDQALSSLSAEQPEPVFNTSRLLEIQAVEAGIRDHHALLIEHEENRRGLEALANKDGLTGLMNRRHFMQSAEIELQRAQRYRRPVTVAMADLDNFKRLNDTYGHAAGDAVLRAFAARVGEMLRGSDLVCRYGGEEFAFLFPEISPLETAGLAERLRIACADNEVVLPDGRRIKATVSIGLADASATPIEIALSHADAALYEAKRQGRNRVVLGEPPVTNSPQEKT